MPSESRSSEPLTEAFRSAIEALAEAGASYALIGGFAVAHHGLPRPTRDIDILLRMPRIAIPGLLEAFHRRGFELDRDRVLKELRDDHLSEVRYRGIRVDLLDAVVPILVRTVERARSVEIDGSPVSIARPEELIVLKLIAGRETDLLDVKGILAAQRDRIDLDAVREGLRESCGPEACEAFERMLSRGDDLA